MKTKIIAEVLVYKIDWEIIHIHQVSWIPRIKTRLPEIMSKGMKEYASKMDMLSVEDLQETWKTSYEDIWIELIKKEIEIEL